MNLSKHIKLTKCLAYASGTAARDGATLDMAGWDGVLAIVINATIASSAVGDFHWEQGATDPPTTDLAGTAIAIVAGDSDKVVVSDLYRPQKRYVRGVITKDASHAQAESVIYLQYRGRKVPVTNMGADSYELQVSPAEGTK